MLKILRGYVFWTYERGSMHYDIMVTLILLFVFLSPRVINYRDRPKFQLPSQIMVENDGSGDLVYQVRAQDVQGSLRAGNDADVETRRALRHLIEPVAGDVSVQRYETLMTNGQVSGYRVWARR